MATIKDIANAAGVSVATVSHVVNNTRFVSPELRKRVEEAIANAETPPNFVVKKKMQEKERKKNKMLMEEQKAIVADAGPEFISILHHLLLPTLTVLLNRNYVNWQGSRDVNWFV